MEKERENHGRREGIRNRILRTYLTNDKKEEDRSVNATGDELLQRQKKIHLNVLS